METVDTDVGVSRPGLINSKSNYHLISSYSNTATYKSYSTVVRIKENYCQPKKL